MRRSPPASGRRQQTGCRCGARNGSLPINRWRIQLRRQPELADEGSPTGVDPLIRSRRVEQVVVIGPINSQVDEAEEMRRRGRSLKVQIWRPIVAVGTSSSSTADRSVRNGHHTIAERLPRAGLRIIATPGFCVSGLAPLHCLGTLTRLAVERTTKSLPGAPRLGLSG